MISSDAYILILVILAVAFLILTTTLVMLIRKRGDRDLAETFKILIPTISSIFDNPFFWLDIDGEKINFANENAAKALGFNPYELQNKNIKSIIGDELDLKSDESVKQGKTLVRQINFIKKNSERLSLEITILTVNTTTGIKLGYAMIAEDAHEKEQSLLNKSIEQYKQSLDQTKQNISQLFSKCAKITTAIRNVSVSPKNNLEDILKNIAQEIHTAFDSYMSILWISGDGEEKLKLSGQWGLTDAGFQKFQSNTPLKDKMLKSINRKQVILEDISSISDPIKNFLAEEGVSFMAEVPFFENGNIRGIMEIYFKKNSLDYEIYQQLLSHMSSLLTVLCAIFHMKIATTTEFNMLSKEHAKTDDKLNEKIKIQEQELQELKRLQELTIGRELKMIELKKKIEIIEEELKARRNSAQ